MRSCVLVSGVVGLGLVACRPREAVIDAAPGPDAGPSVSVSGSSRIHYPATVGSFVDVVADASEAVVAIRATTPIKSGPAAMFPGAQEATPDVALGSGFVIQHGGTFVLTNHHVIASSPEIRVVLPDGSEAAAEVLGSDPRLDLALLRIDVPRLKALAFDKSSELQVGEWVIALGNPFGNEVTASAGIVSSVGRSAGSVMGGPPSLYRTYLQTDARIHRGNSGGPLLDTAGRVVGVNVATEDRASELSFAIPSDRVLEVLDQLRDEGKVSRAYLGAIVNAVTPELAQRLGVPAQPGKPGGAVVTQVESGSPALRAGIRPGDVILTWGGKHVDDKNLPGVVSSSPVDKVVKVEVFRSGATMVLNVVPARVPT